MNILKTASVTLLMAAAAAVSAWAQTTLPHQLAPTESPPGKVTGQVDLGAEFPLMKGFTFVQTYTVVPPGQGRALHSHAGVPEIVRILSGTLTEQHNGGGPPTPYGPGTTFINAGGKQHVWANLGTEPVVFIATQVRPANVAGPSPVPESK